MMEPNDMKNAEDVVVESGPVGPSKLEKNWAMGCHLVGLCGLVVPVPLAGLIGVLILWVMKRDDGKFIDSQGREALNFQISLLIYLLVSLMLFAIGIGFILLFAVAIFGIVCMIMAAIKASEGVEFQYPMCIRLIK